MSTTIAPTKPRAASRESSRTPPLTVSRPELLINGSDRDFRALVHGMLAFAARLEAVRNGFAGMLGLTGIQYTILISVSHQERAGEVSVSMIAAHLHISGAFVTIETGKLLKLGLLTKRPDPRDRRRVCLSITKKGADLLHRLAPTQAQVNDVLFEFLDAVRFRELRGLVDRMTECGDRSVALLEYLANHIA
jgi:DNA-binding MarR family transcriptional regulator